MNRRKKYGMILMCLLLLFSFAIPVDAAGYQNPDTVYDAYVYNNGDPVAIQMPYVFERKLTERFQEISDLFYCKEDQRLYTADPKAGNITVFDSELKKIYVLDTFDNNGEADALAGCSGVCVRDGILYVADTDNNRIVTFRADDYSFVRSFDKPEIKQLGENYNYQPIRLAVGITGQMYVVAKGVNSGFIVLDTDGGFQSFIGAPEVKTDFLDEIWKMFMTKAQKEALTKSVPTEYNSILFDDSGFLYATTKSEGVQPIVRLNLQGTDILKSTGDEMITGDTEYIPTSSAFVDACVDSNGVYYALDSYLGHVFAYNSDGKLLFAFGKNGAQSGTTSSPMAIECMGDRILIADAVTGYINVFECTEFGEAILTADATMNAGDYDVAKECWEHVLGYCGTYTLAKESLGKLALYEKDYQKSMEYAKNAVDKEAYSDAFRSYRSNYIYENYLFLLLILAGAIACLMLYKKVWLKTKWAGMFRESRLGKGLTYAKYCSFHPLDGFWCLKREKRGNLLTANVIVALFLIIYLLNVQFSGYLFLDGQPEDVDAIIALLAAIILMVTYCVGNWCFTSLMDGKGTMKDIYISMATALRPYIAGGIVLFALSHVLSQQEAFLYSTIKMILMIWIAGLIFFGMMMTHDYSLGQGIKTMILTIIGMALILFVTLVFFNLVDDMVRFFYSIYRELLYRNI